MLRLAEVQIRILSKIEQNLDITLQQVAVECRYWQPDSQSILFKNRTQCQQPQHIKSLQLAGIVVVGIWLESVHLRLIAVRSAKSKNIEGFCTPPVHKITHKWPHNKHRQKKNTQVVTFLPNIKSNRKHVSVKLNSHCSVTNRHCLRHNPYLRHYRKP